MRFVKHSAIVLVLCVAAGSTAAIAAQEDGPATCTTAARQIDAVLVTNQQLGSETVLKEKKLGYYFCSQGFYQFGMRHYAKALEILGVGKG
jgi:hypothetical protein